MHSIPNRLIRNTIGMGLTHRFGISIGMGMLSNSIKLSKSVGFPRKSTDSPKTRDYHKVHRQYYRIRPRLWDVCIGFCERVRQQTNPSA